MAVVIDISPKFFMSFKNIYIIQNFHILKYGLQINFYIPLETEDKIKITLGINKSVKYKK